MLIKECAWLVKPTNAYITKEASESAAGHRSGTEIPLSNWRDFCSYVIEQPIVVSLDDLQKIPGKRRPKARVLCGYSIARYQDRHRKKAHIIDLHAVGVDLDSSTLTPEELAEALHSLGLAAIWHTTLSHGLAGPRYRVVFPLSGPCTDIAKWERTRDNLTARMADIGASRDEGAKDPSRFWYWPACVDVADYRHGVVNGELLELTKVPKGYTSTDIASTMRPPPMPRSTAQQKENPTSSAVFSSSIKSNTYDLGWVHRQMQEYVTLPQGSRAAWIGPKCKTIGGLYAGGAFERSISEGSVIDTILGYVMQNSSRSKKQELNFIQGAWDAGKRAPLESKKKAKTEARTEKEPRKAEKVQPVAPCAEDVPLLVSGTNKVYRNVENFRRLLRASPIGKNLFYNIILQRICISDDIPCGWRPYSEISDGEEINRWIGSTGLGAWPDIPGNQIVGLVDSLAKERKRNPFREQRENTRWDGIHRVDTALIKYAQAQDTELNRLISKNLFISLMARSCSDTPTKVDTVVVLEGPQGCGKSRFVQALGGEYYVAYSGKYTNERSTYLTLQGCLVAELSELAGMSKQDIESAKAFLSMSENVYEPKYLSIPVREVRRFIAIGTTNKHIYLSDDTGNRRYNGIAVGKIDVASFERDREQILAEAFDRWQSGEAWWFETEAHEQLALEAQEDREQELPYLSVIRDNIGAIDVLTTARIIERCLGLEKQHWTKSLSNQVADIMRKLGYRSASIRHEGLKVRRWVKE